MATRLTWRQVARHEYYAGLGLSIVACYPLMIPVIPVIGFFKSDGELPLGALVFAWAFYTLFTGVILLLTWLRIRRVLHICKVGRVVEGTVVANFYEEFRDKPPGNFPSGGALVLEYELDGGVRESWIAVWRTRACEAIEVGDPINLAVDRSQPLLAIPIDLFSKTR